MCTHSKKADGRQDAESRTRDQKRWQEEGRPCATECSVGGLEVCVCMSRRERAWDVNVKLQAHREQENTF